MNNMPTDIYAANVCVAVTNYKNREKSTKIFKEIFQKSKIRSIYVRMQCSLCYKKRKSRNIDQFL